MHATFPLLPAIMSFLAGAMVVLQAPINARLGNIMGGPFAGALLSFITGTCLLALVIAVLRKPILIGNIAQTSPWMWLGGAMGALFVFTTIFAVPKLGTAGMVALIIAGQVLFSLVVDHYGFLLPQATPITTTRIIGAGFLIAGVYMIMSAKM